jgi:hypothetical protein
VFEVKDDKLMDVGKKLKEKVNIMRIMKNSEARNSRSLDSGS